MVCYSVVRFYGRSEVGKCVMLYVVRSKVGKCGMLYVVRFVWIDHVLLFKLMSLRNI